MNNNQNLLQAYQSLIADPSAFFIYEDGRVREVLDSPGSKLQLYSGSFNPIHDGHRTIFKSIRVDTNSYTGSKKFYELSINRRDKEPLPFNELELRLRQFGAREPVIVMDAPYFLQKTGVLRNYEVEFHIGIDTAERIIRDHGVLGCQGIGASFKVYDRVVYEVRNSFLDLDSVPANFSRAYLSDESFIHMSSTDIRNGKY